MSGTKRRKFLSVSCVVVAVLALWTYVAGQPNFGGKKACESWTGIAGLSDLDMSTEWVGVDFSVAHQFRYQLTPVAFADLKVLLQDNGFAPFSEGGLEFEDYSSEGLGSNLLMTQLSRVFFIVCEETLVLEVIILP